MSRPAATPKQNFLQTMLLALTVMMGVQLYMNAQQKHVVQYEGKTLVTVADQLGALRDANAKNLVDPINQVYSDYQKTVDEDQKKNLITPVQAEADKVEGAILVADTQLKAGLQKDESSRIRLAYQTVQRYERTLATAPIWNTPFKIQDPKLPPEISGHDLHQRIVATLSERNKTDLIWGFIPGGFQFIDTLVSLTGKNPAFSYAFAAFLLALSVRAIVFPLAQKQLMFSRQMSQLGPRVSEIKEKYKDDQVQQNAKVMELYQEYGINPFSGCAPAFIQMPLFFTVYQCMLHYQFEFQKGYFLWINPQASQASHGFLGANLGQQDYILIVLYGISMVISTMLTPITDPTQAKTQRLMGVGMSVVFTFFMFTGMFPVVSGFVLYWTFTNILATAQSLRAYRMPLPPLVRVNAPGGGVYPKGGAQGKWAKMIEEAQKVAAEQKAANDAKGSDGKEPSSKKNGTIPNGKPKTNGKLNVEKPVETPPSNSLEAPKHKPKKRN